MPELENFGNTPNWIKENLSEGNFKILKNRSADVFRHKGCSQKLKKLIQQEVTDFDEALTKTIDWYSKLKSKDV